MNAEYWSSTEDYEILQGIFFRRWIFSIKKEAFCVAVKQEEKLMVMPEHISQISLGKALSAET